MTSSTSLHLEDVRVPQQVDVLAQEHPERRTVELDAVVGFQVEILDGHVLAVGQDHEPARGIVVETEAAGPLDVEFAARRLLSALVCTNRPLISVI